jgi:HD-like signal output (HDOD) protein
MKIDGNMTAKKRILFVDDETLVLQGLQRMLRSLRQEWDMEFVESGAKALERMAQIQFDVIVSDMRMPGMNGAELLNEVMKRYPKTARLILSGHADKELILKCVGSTHQFLSKPCDPEALKATVLRASSVEASLQNEALRRLVSQMDRLPSIPSLYTEIVEVLQNPEATVEEVGEIIGRDIGMTAKILKLVNSAFFGLRRQVSSPAEAATYLGLDTIRSLVLSINAFSQFQSLKLEGFSLELLGAHSLETAAAAKVIAREEGAEQKLVDEAFVAGMLHDTGKLVLAANFPEQFNRAVRGAVRQKLELTAAEKQIFGANHAEVGGYLLGLWGLPVPVVEAIGLHHCPGRALQKTFSPLAAVHVANVLVQEQHAAKEAIPCSPIDTNYLGDLGLSDRLDIWRGAWHDNLSKGKAA